MGEIVGTILSWITKIQISKFWIKGHEIHSTLLFLAGIGVGALLCISELIPKTKDTLGVNLLVNTIDAENRATRDSTYTLEYMRALENYYKHNKEVYFNSK